MSKAETTVITAEDFIAYLEAIPVSVIEDASVYLMKDTRNKQSTFKDMQIAAMQALYEAIKTPLMEAEMLCKDGLIVKQTYHENGELKVRYIQKSEIVLEDKDEK
ncbi:MAG: hypothetical protein COV55_02770 [Candidatus Komeilibacteria bacterium CG11_big_fil_rev_8_21_14_0_20_36_20]|uniref:Uncharacterized protein n=1 Tax=Candidatus Komeilibacteria bacterium CG11_big_fil_rev_8_21_14_0_20_36_20 TaxID=1974477 RepID=A0A2H0NCR4_9BACT|nr:MAG: hypothetical protein COV55_02770 [Candidatus Komeilibacteria bacterium CG11_big_fil_rev_8_21_14_0_20_36_20]